jgi:hypothetical protein
MHNSPHRRGTILTIAITVFTLALAGVAAAGASTEKEDDTLLTFGYDEVNHVLIANVSGTDTPYDCTLAATYKTQYGEAVDAAVPIDMLFDEGLNPVEFGNRPIDLVGDDYTPADAPIVYSGADGECGLSGVVVGGPNGQINHGQVMKAFHSLIDMKGHGCVNRIIAQSDLGKGDQQVKTSDVDPLFEISAEGVVTFASETTDCTHGRDKDKDSVEDDDNEIDHPSNRSTDKKPKRAKPQRGRDK